jgi:hypothetical protein
LKGRSGGQRIETHWWCGDDPAEEDDIRYRPLELWSVNCTQAVQQLHIIKAALNDDAGRYSPVRRTMARLHQSEILLYLRSRICCNVPLEITLAPLGVLPSGF